MKDQSIIRYEELFLNSMPVTNRTFMSRYILNYDGINLFSNSIHSIYVEDSDTYKADIDSIIAHVSKEHTPAFRIIETSDYSRIDRYLMVQNFSKIASSLILLTNLIGKEKKLFPYASFYENGILLDKNISQNDSKWLDDYFFLCNMNSELQNRFLDMLVLSKVDNYAFTLLLENRLIGQAFCTKHGEIFLIQNIIVNSKYQSLGYGDRILKSILTYAMRSGAKYVLAEISLEDEKNKKLFKSNYFDLLYQAYYRVML